jgi:hydrogenase/urease accessory protein HupE
MLAAAMLVLLPVSAPAHPANVAYARIAVQDRLVEIALSANLFELDLLLSLDRDLDGRVGASELEARRADIADYLRRHISVSATRSALRGNIVALGIDRGRDDKPLLSATLRFESEASIREVAIVCAPLTELGADHTTLATIAIGGRTEEFAFRRGAVYRETRGGLASALEFLRLGIVHILIGYDHLAFLIGLLLIGGRLRTIVTIVTGFTVAHSVTLALAALDVVRVNPTLVEAGIALSVIYVAVESLFVRTLDVRWAVAFLFGLVHGFGFAEVLREMALPRSGLVLSLLSFNLGVELAQVAIVLLVLPVLRLLALTRVHRLATRTAAAVILSLGLFWLYERVL